MPCRGRVYVGDGSTGAGVIPVASGSRMWSGLPYITGLYKGAATV